MKKNKAFDTNFQFLLTIFYFILFFIKNSMLSSRCWKCLRYPQIQWFVCLYFLSYGFVSMRKGVRAMFGRHGCVK
jgi:hypothetical protein